jgi:hypothetical protein
VVFGVGVIISAGVLAPTGTYVKEPTTSRSTAATLNLTGDPGPGRHRRCFMILVEACSRPATSTVRANP